MKFDKKFSLLGGVLLAVLVVTSGQLTISAQTTTKTDDKIDKSTLVAKNTETPTDPATSKTRVFPRKKTSSSGDWTGWYVGGYAGVGLNRSGASTTTVFSPTGYFATSSVPAINTVGTQSLSQTRFSGGGTVGYNHQSNNWVVGAEADFGFLSGTPTATGTATYPCCAPSAFTVTQTSRNRFLMTARGRVGYAFNNVLFYGTGGLAVTRINYAELFTDTFATARETGAFIRTKAGWVGGGGFEYKATAKWSIKGEYLFEDFRRSGTTSTNLTAFSPPIAFPTNIFTHSIFTKQHEIRFGFNYHF